MIVHIDGQGIGQFCPPYIVAEISANHNGSIERAKHIMQQAQAAGVNAIKIQTYTADTITLDCDNPEFTISSGLWQGQTLHQLYRQAYTPWEWHAELFRYAKSIGVTLFSSPFDYSAIDLLESLNTPAYKIASFEMIDLPLIRYAAATGKPLIISTGMATLLEIEEAINAARDGGCEELIVLHCVSGYPAPLADYNLLTLADMANRYRVVVGLSDHTLSNTTAVASVALGAAFIEKHVTLDRNGGGPDDSFSLEPTQLQELCQSCHDAWRALGRVDYERKPSEQGNVQFRRSLYIVADIKQGERFDHQNLRSIRPGFGCLPKLLPDLIGKRATCDLKRGTAMKLEYAQ